MIGFFPLVRQLHSDTSRADQYIGGFQAGGRSPGSNVMTGRLTDGLDCI
jgi:hypothetical protein